MILFVACLALMGQADPSLKPAVDHNDRPAERYRFVEDLDNDGDQDLILSEPMRAFGTMGGMWMVYLNENGEWREIDSISAHPKAVTLEQHRSDTSRIWVYLKGAAWYGSLGYYELKDGKLGNYIGLEIFPDPAGESLGIRLYQAVFDANLTLEPERFRTQGNTVTWSMRH